MIVEGVITLIIVGAMLYVSPGVLGQVKAAAPLVCSTAGGGCSVVDATLNQTSASIGTSVAGGLSLGAISPIMIGIGLMIGAFMIIRRQ